jgi:predicted site-specific integrase-resolvase
MNIRNPTYLPLVDACKAHGISRSVAYELARDGTLETFLIGKRRYVRMDSLRTLPERISEARREAS